MLKKPAGSRASSVTSGFSSDFAARARALKGLDPEAFDFAHESPDLLFDGRLSRDLVANALDEVLLIQCQSLGPRERPSALAVLRLITSSARVGTSTGRSPEFAPSKNPFYEIACSFKRESSIVHQHGQFGESTAPSSGSIGASG